MNNFDLLEMELFAEDAFRVKRAYIDISDGDLIAGILLGQIIYWHLPNKQGKSKLRARDKQGDFVLVKERTSWYDEIRITPRQYDRAIKILRDKGYVETGTTMFNAKRTQTIKLLKENVMKALSGLYETSTPVLTKGEDRSYTNVNTGLNESVRPITEITTKITTKNTTDIKEHGALDSTPPSVNKKDTPQLSDVPHDKKVNLRKLCPQSKVYIYDTIIGHLNKVTGKNFSPYGEANQKAINGRLNEGYTIQDILNVIDIKSQQWSRNKKMSKYLRPSTLFRKSKFEGYLNEYKEQCEVQEEVKHEANTIEQNITTRNIDVSKSPF